MKTSLLICLFIVLPAVAMASVPRAGTCGGCHSENFRSWDDSAHSESILNDKFRAALKHYLHSDKSKGGTYCFGCHAPSIVISGKEFEATRKVLKGQPLRGGVTCVACHGVESIKKGEVRYETAEIPSYHRVKDLKNIDRKTLCTTCHNEIAEQAEIEAPQQGLLKGVALKLGLIVDDGATTKTDHSFSGLLPADKERKCPGLKDYAVTKVEGH